MTNRQMALDVALPRIVVEHRLARVAAQRVADVRAAAISARTAATNSSTSPGVHSTARWSVTVGSPAGEVVDTQRRRQHFADLLEVAADDAAAHRHVFEQLGRRAEELAVDHVAAVRRDVDVARAQQPRALPPAARGRPSSRDRASWCSATALSTSGL